MSLFIEEFHIEGETDGVEYTEDFLMDDEIVLKEKDNNTYIQKYKYEFISNFKIIKNIEVHF
jgi:hypothetical protein